MPYARPGGLCLTCSAHARVSAERLCDLAVLTLSGLFLLAFANGGRVCVPPCVVSPHLCSWCTCMDGTALLVAGASPPPPSFPFALTTMDACYFPDRAAISQAPCVAGEGPGCADAAEDNPLVKRLQENSRKNKEANNQAMLEKYWREGYVAGAGGRV